MKVSIDISYYPLHQEFVPHILDFISRLKQHDGLKAETNGMSTQVFGEYDLVMDAIRDEIRASFALPHSVFILKIVNADLQ